MASCYYHNFRSDVPDLLPVIPMHLHPSALFQLHDTLTTSHLELTQTYDRVQYWHGLCHSVVATWLRVTCANAVKSPRFLLGASTQ